ncbi:succinate dehydrogenase assembly factor 2 [Salinisphaera sp. USBA-960]|uniref:FAD assembly factor SdhE n=1 Tax=Salinisphaera orenii TaxID=856731 RepID=UPI0013A67DDD|nr:succinate dehydrogenase assembly factor 2 [Salifodinibacter halophilus]NNC26072.1 succinate dehydrogenase assembly factor 2 [Salifodinibacter halophilus]
MRSEPAEEKSRVRWHCRRGMKELDVLLERFMVTDYDGLTVAEHQALCHLLDNVDPDLYMMIMGRMAAASDTEAQLLARIRAHKKPAGT